MKKLLNILPFIRQWFVAQREYLPIAAALFILVKIPAILRFFDPTAAPVDLGIFSTIILTVVAILIFKSLTWILIRSLWPDLADYAQNKFANDFNELEPWQRVKIFLGFYLVLFVSFVLAFKAL